MVIQQNINLAADLVLTPKSGFDFQLACKVVWVVLGLLLLRSVFTGLSLSYNLFRGSRLTREHARSMELLSDYERNYYIVNQTEGSDQMIGGGAGRIGRVYYILRGLAQHKLPGARLDKIGISQDGATFAGVAENVDVALKLIALLKEQLGSMVDFNHSDIKYREDGMVDFSLVADEKATAAQSKQGS